MPIKGSNLSNPLKSHDVKGNLTPKYSEIRQMNRSTFKGRGPESLNSLQKTYPIRKFIHFDLWWYENLQKVPKSHKIG